MALEAAEANSLCAALAGCFADTQTRAAYLGIHAGLQDGSLTLAQAKRIVNGIFAPMFDAGVSDGQQQILDYERRQLYFALNEVEAARRNGSLPAGQNLAELFDACLAALNVRQS